MPTGETGPVKKIIRYSSSKLPMNQYSHTLSHEFVVLNYRNNVSFILYSYSYFYFCLSPSRFEVFLLFEKTKFNRIHLMADAAKNKKKQNDDYIHKRIRLTTSLLSWQQHNNSLCWVKQVRYYFNFYYCIFHDPYGKYESTFSQQIKIIFNFLFYFSFHIIKLMSIIGKLLFVAPRRISLTL